MSFAPRGFKSFASSMPAWIKDKLFQKTDSEELRVHSTNRLIGKAVLCFPTTTCRMPQVHFTHHHSIKPQFYIRWCGRMDYYILAVGDGKALEVLKDIQFPHSLGLLYSAFTFYLGFKVNSGEYKVMGLT